MTSRSLFAAAILAWIAAAGAVGATWLEVRRVERTLAGISPPPSPSAPDDSRAKNSLKEISAASAQIEKDLTRLEKALSQVRLSEQEDLKEKVIEKVKELDLTDVDLPPEFLPPAKDRGRGRGREDRQR